MLKKYFFNLLDNNTLVPDKKNPFFANFVCIATKFSSGIQSASINIKYSLLEHSTARFLILLALNPWSGCHMCLILRPFFLYFVKISFDLIVDPSSAIIISISKPKSITLFKIKSSSDRLLKKVIKSEAFIFYLKKIILGIYNIPLQHLK